MLKFLFNKVAGLQVLSCEHLKIFKNSYFYRTHLVGASEWNLFLTVESFTLFSVKLNDPSKSKTLTLTLFLMPTIRYIFRET